MNNKLKLFRLAAKKVAADEQFLAYYIKEKSWRHLRCTQLQFYQLCLCKRPKNSDGLRKISEYCGINNDLLKSYLGF